MALTSTSQISLEFLAHAKEAAPTIVKERAKIVRPRKARDLSTMFWHKIKDVTVESLKEGRPWLAEKNFVLLADDVALGRWVDEVLTDQSRWKAPYTKSPERMPVVAVDTENHGLDTRILHHMRQGFDPAGNITWSPVYEVKIEIAGVCLSVDGITGIYVPITHVDGNNCTREGVRYHLQRLFNVSHLVFYNAKYDREVLRLTLDLKLRSYPHYEDVQSLKYINDPKAKLNEGDKTSFAGDAIGLKGLSWRDLGYKQIELDAIAKVKADWRNPQTGEVTSRQQYVPFMWVPTALAVWYAAGDAICTWLLWEKYRDLAQSRVLPHAIDGELIDSLTWIERQRFLIDTVEHHRMVVWHEHKMAEQRTELRQLANAQGWKEDLDENEALIETSKFNVDSGKMLPDFLYRIKGLKVVKVSEKTGKPSTDKSALLELMKLYPEDTFLRALKKYKEYVALHPENLAYDPHDNSARIYIKQSTVAGGRLAASGGNFHRDGGVSLNPQAIKKVGNNWFVKGRVLAPDRIAPEEIEAFEEADLHPSCFREAEEDVVIGYRDEIRLDPVTGEPILARSDEEFEDEDGNLVWDEGDDRADGQPIIDRIPVTEKQTVRKKASGIINNHIGNYVGYAICLVPKCTTCAAKHGVLIESGQMDANQILNFRRLFIAQKGWTLASSDWSNVEMRIAANISGEPKFIKEFLEGEGDFHTLTAIACFPEFTLPETSKARRKELRNLAKIINFALLYGGSAFTIFTNMRTEMPDITWKDAQAMVDLYWASVPLFKSFCEGKQAIARDHFFCETALGRVVNFQSALETEGLRVPTQAEMDNNWDYIRLRKRHIAAEEANDLELATRLKAHMDRLWKDPDSGVRNAQYFNKFLSKIQRVSVNVPFQGLAGDFMRIVINRVRKWAEGREPAVQSVLLMHSSVHDELDFTFKNEYAAFVVPRITREMRLRKLHAARKWIVPLEIDTEYGPSWDVKWHLTGDKDHMPSGWTDIEGMERYLPGDMTQAVFDRLLRAVLGCQSETEFKVRTWMVANLHPRSANAQEAVFKDLKGKPLAAEKREKQLYALMHLHEYWSVDEVPDGQEAELETLEQYEARCGLTVVDRGWMPEGGYLGSVPFDQVLRPAVPVLGPEPLPEAEPAPPLPKKGTLAAREFAGQVTMFGEPEPKPEPESVGEDEWCEEAEEAEEAPDYEEPEEDTSFNPEAFVPPTVYAVTPAPTSLMVEEELFMPEPRRRVRELVEAPAPTQTNVIEIRVNMPPPVSLIRKPHNPRALQELRADLGREDFQRLMLDLGIGRMTFEVLFMGQEVAIPNRSGDRPIPQEYLAS